MRKWLACSEAGSQFHRNPQYCPGNILIDMKELMMAIIMTSGVLMGLTPVVIGQVHSVYYVQRRSTLVISLIVSMCLGMLALVFSMLWLLGMRAYILLWGLPFGLFLAQLVVVLGVSINFWLGRSGIRKK